MNIAGGGNYGKQARNCQVLSEIYRVGVHSFLVVVKNWHTYQTLTLATTAANTA